MKTRSVLTLTCLEDRVVPDAYLVKNFSDDVNTANSLRWCIKQANDHAGADTISFDKTVQFVGNTIQMASGQYELAANGGDLTIDGALGADAKGKDRGVVKIVGVMRAQAQPTDRHFYIPSGVKLFLKNAHLTGGRSLNQPPGQPQTRGGSIRVGPGGNLELYKCELSDNKSYSGGAIQGDPGTTQSPTTITIDTCNIHDNTQGGGVWILWGTNLTIKYSQITNNAPIAVKVNGDIGLNAQAVNVEISDTDFIKNEGGGGGALQIFGRNTTVDVNVCKFEENKAIRQPGAAPANGGAINIWDQTISTVVNISKSDFIANSATDDGGAIWIDRANLTLTQVTVTKNTAGGKGAGIFNGKDGKVKVTNSTIKDDTVNVPVGGGGGGVGAGIFNDGGSVTLVNTIVSGNWTNAGNGGLADDTAGAFTSLGHNLLGSVAYSTGWMVSDHTGVNDPGLAYVYDGTHLPYYTPLVGSPALDTGDSDYAPDVFDQRGTGFDRIVGLAIDIGSIERGPNLSPIPTNDTAVTAVNIPVTVPVLSNDVDPNGDILSITSVTQGANGTVAITDGGTGLSYTPNNGYVGIDKFYYTVSDGNGHSATASVRVTVTPSGEPLVAVRGEDGFFTNTLAPTNDASTGAVSLGFTIHFSGTDYSQVYVNNNGNVTFGSALPTATPTVLSNLTEPILAPFWADVDTRGAGVVTYGTGTVNGAEAFAVTWVDVGYYNQHVDKFNRFQLVIIDRTDIAPGTFDVEYNYDRMAWETGDASGGSGGLGGTSARVGYADGAGSAFEVAGSAVNGSLLDGGSHALVARALSSDVLGRYVFRFGGSGLPSANSPPMATADVASTSEDIAVAISVLSNDTDPELNDLWVRGATQGAHGRVISTSTEVIYIPDADWHGTDAFQYTVDDGFGGTATATVSVTVAPVNDAPVVSDVPAMTPQNTAIDIDLRTLVTDVETAPNDLTFAVAGAQHGTVTLLSDGHTARFTPDAGFHDTASFTFTVTDTGDGPSAPITTASNPVAISVNAPPTAGDVSVSYHVVVGQPLVVYPMCSDPDGDELTRTVVSQPAHGTVAWDEAYGGWVYTNTDPTYTGTETFRYAVSDGRGGTATGTVTITLTNQPPTGDATVSLSVANSAPIWISPDVWDPDSDELTVTSVVQPSVGSVSPDPSGPGVTYFPPPGFTGTVTFSYTVSDGHGGSLVVNVSITIDDMGG